MESLISILKETCYDDLSQYLSIFITLIVLMASWIYTYIQLDPLALYSMFSFNKLYTLNTLKSKMR